MDMAHYLSISRLVKIIRKPGFWFILTLIALITLSHYAEAVEHPAPLSHLTANLGLDRHAFERILYLAPIVWAGFIFGWQGTLVFSLIALACMLPRVIFISLYPVDALLETSAVFVIGNVLAISFNALRRERENRIQLESTQHELRESEQRYRGLFENAHDAIWIQDMEGNIITANEATAKLTSYNVEQLIHMNVTSFLSAEGLEVAREVRHRLLKGETIGDSYDQQLIRKDGEKAFLRLSSSLIHTGNEPVAFQHIARDVTQERQMHENLRFYVQQATRAQEEERQRISRELHDDTIQALVVLSRQLDALASSSEGLPENKITHLEGLRQQTNNIMQGLRRLSQDLRPAALDSLGLLPALEWLASDVAEYSGLETKVNLVGTKRRFPEEVELVLFRIAQEALRNVWRHAEATQVEIVLEFEGKNVRITVSDNGKGFILPPTINDLARDGKLGLAGMHERAQLLSGTLTVQSQPGEGTRITLEIPV